MTTWGFVESNSIAAVASAFALGREDLIPDLFRGVLGTLDARESGGFERFLHYLDRHVELDGDDHGPMASRMLISVCGDDPVRWRDARFAAMTALEARLALWDGVLAEIEGDPSSFLSQDLRKGLPSPIPDDPPPPPHGAVRVIRLCGLGLPGHSNASSGCAVRAQSGL